MTGDKTFDKMMELNDENVILRKRVEELEKRVDELTKEIEAINDVAWRGI